MNETDFAVNPQLVISKLSSRIADMSLQIALLESVIDSLKMELAAVEEKNGLT